MVRFNAIIITSLIAVYANVYSQDINTTQLKVYHSIQEGLKEPNKVKKLEIINLQDTDSLVLLTKFPNLESLSLIDHHETLAPEEIASITGLKELKFINDDYYLIPESYKELVNLEKLELIHDTHLNIQSTFSFIEALPELKELRIEGLYGPVLSEQLKFPSQLQILSLRNNALNALPKGISTLTNLKILDIGHNEFLELPAFIVNLEKLHTLYLDHSPFLHYESTFKLLKKLPALNNAHLEGNQLTQSFIQKQMQDAVFKVFIDEDNSFDSENYTPHINMFLPPMPSKSYTPKTASYKIPLTKK